MGIADRMVCRASLEEVSKVASAVSSNLVSVGASLSHVHVPGREPTDEFGDSNDVELGMGIHNEEGFKRLTTDLPGLIKQMLAQLLDAGDTDRAYVNFRPSESVVLLINNLGGVSLLELGCITEEVCSQLQSSYLLQPVRILAGTYMSSLNGLGFSISILKIVSTRLASGGSMVELLDAPGEATGWTAAVQQDTWTTVLEDTQQLRLQKEWKGEFQLTTSKLTSKQSRLHEHAFNHLTFFGSGCWTSCETTEVGSQKIDIRGARTHEV